MILLVPLKKSNYYNLRTLIFALMCFEKIYVIVKGLAYEDKCLNKQNKQILAYCICLAIEIKKGEKKEGKKI